MKSHSFAAVIAVVSMVVCFQCCKKGSNSPDPPVPEYESQGTITVIDPQFEKDNIRLTAYLITGNTLKLSIDSISFSEKMPMTISMQLMPVDYTREGDNIVFHTDKGTPVINGQQQESYTVRDMQGIIRSDSLLFTTRFGEYECKYSGKITNTRNTL